MLRCVRHCDTVHLHLHDNCMRWTDGYKILTLTDRKSIDDANVDTDNEESESLSHLHLKSRQMSGRVYAGVKGAWNDFDNLYLKQLFGGLRSVRSGANRPNHGHYEMTKAHTDSLDEDE